MEDYAYIGQLIARYPQLAVCRDALISAYRILEASFAAGGKLLVAGNGGSAADSDHIAGELLKGFVSGLHAGNYDITHIFIDNFLKLVGDKAMAGLDPFLDWLDAFSAQQNVEVVISLSADQSAASERVRQYLI